VLVISCIKKFEAFTPVKSQVEIEVKSFHPEDGGVMNSETLVYYHNITRRHSKQYLNLNLY
jgi:hypothetical protein